MSKEQSAVDDIGPRERFSRLFRRERCGARAAMLAIGLVSMGGAAHAQGGVQITPPGGAERFGGDVHSTASYASNISGGDDTLAAIRNIEPADITYNLGATLKFQLLSGRKVMFLTAAADAHRHQNNKLLDGEDYQVTGGIGGQVGPCSGLLGGIYARRQALLEDLALPVATNITESPSASVSLSCGRGGIVGGFQASVGKLQNDLKRVGFVDSESKAATFTVGYSNKTLGDLSLIAQYSQIDYSPAMVSSAPAAPINPGFETYGLGLQYKRKIGMRLNGTMSVSATKLKSDPVAGTATTLPSSGATSNGITANAALSYTATSRIQLQLAYDRGYQASVLVSSSYLYSESLNFNVSYRLSQRINFGAAVSRVHDEYRGGVPTTLQLRDSDALTGTLSANLRVGRNINLTLSGSHSERTADVAIYDFNSNNVTLGLATQF